MMADFDHGAYLCVLLLPLSTAMHSANVRPSWANGQADAVRASPRTIDVQRLSPRGTGGGVNVVGLTSAGLKTVTFRVSGMATSDAAIAAIS